MLRARSTLHQAQERHLMARPVATRKPAPKKTLRQADAESDISSSDRVVEHITSGILAGRFVPGQRLVEADLTHTLQVSRGPVREAFRRLDALGILARTMHRGASVRTLSRTEALDLLAASEPLSQLAGRLAAERMATRPKGFDAAAFERELKPFRDRVEDSRNLLGQRQRFYDLIIAMSGNTQLPSMMPNMRIQLLRLQIQSFRDMDDRRQHLDDYATVARAILAGNSKAAEKALAAHTRHTHQNIVDLPDAAFPRPVAD
jgi:DNA-binding GntR family transcriptional regulator